MARWRGTENGGRGRDRTGGLVVANDALSQLSYTPTGSPTILTDVEKVSKLGNFGRAELFLEWPETNNLICVNQANARTEMNLAV